MTWAPIAALTSGPLYWFLFSLPPSLEEIVEKRGPEHGNWEEVCRLEGPYWMAPTARAASDAGEAWIGEGPDNLKLDRLSRLQAENGCLLTYVDGLPHGARLLSGHLAGRAVYSLENVLYILNEEGQASALWTTGRLDDVVFSDDGAWVAWSSDPDPADDDSLYELTVQRVDGAERWSRPLHLSPDKPYPYELLAYDPSTRETTLELSSRALAKVNADGRIVLRAPQPEGCLDKLLGRWFLHPSGWAYSGFPPTCKLAWDLGGSQRYLDFPTHMHGLPVAGAGIDSVSISPDSTLVAFSTNIMVNHFFSSPVSAEVVQTEDAGEVASIHLRPSAHGWRASVAFLGRDHLLISEQGLIRLIRLHP
jgi:hypothetical protein